MFFFPSDTSDSIITPIKSVRNIGGSPLLSYDYADKRLEYRVTGGTYYLPLLDVTVEAARKLANGLARHLEA
jgi:hypothetical protein